MSDLDHLQGNYFEDAIAPQQGWAMRQWSYSYEVAGRQVSQGPMQPLPLLQDLDYKEMVDLHSALAILDPNCHLYCGKRHLYLGVPVVTLAVQVGGPGSGTGRVEEYAADRFIEFAAEGYRSVLPILTTAGKKMVSILADLAMAEVLKDLVNTENNQ